MRILHVISSLGIAGGGTTSAVVGMALAQKQAGLDLAVAGTFDDKHPPDMAPQLESTGIPVTRIGPCSGPLRRHPQLQPQLDAAIANADVVHIHALWEEIQHQAARIAQKRGVPYLFTAHGMLDPWSLNQGRLKKQLYMLWRLNRNLNQAAAIHLTSDTERDQVERLGYKAKLIVEPLGVDLGEFETLPPRGSFRERHPQLAGKKLVTFLGRIHFEKGLELLVPAMAQLRRARPELDAVLVIVGPDSQGYRATIEKLIAEQGDALRDDAVLFTGMLRGADRVAALVDTDLFSLPSFHENFGVAVIEALACRVPVVISDEVNIHTEIALAQVGGVTSCDVSLLTSELDRWLSDDTLRARAAERARPFVWENYDWSKIAANWVEHYEQLVAPEAHAHPPRQQRR